MLYIGFLFLDILNRMESKYSKTIVQFVIK